MVAVPFRFRRAPTVFLYGWPGRASRGTDRRRAGPALPGGDGTAPEAACAAVMGALAGSEPARDDIALLMIRRHAERERDADA